MSTHSILPTFRDECAVCVVLCCYSSVHSLSFYSCAGENERFENVVYSNSVHSVTHDVSESLVVHKALD